MGEEPFMTTTDANPKAFLPLSPQVYHILVSLVDGDRHGYGMLQEIERRTGDGVRLGTGTLYTAVKRLVASGLIEETEQRPDPDLDDHRRRYYTLTSLGRSVAAADAARMDGLVYMAKEKSLLT